MTFDQETDTAKHGEWIEKIPKKLTESFSEPEPPVIFIGSGFSKEAVPPLKTGDELASLLRTELKIRDNGENLADLLQYLQNEWAGSKKEIVEWLRKNLSDGTSKPGGAHRLLLELPCNEFLTTNYDTLLSDAALEMGYKLTLTDQPGSYKSNINAQHRYKDKAGVLGRMHGGFESEETIVATTDDYIENFNDKGHGWTKLIEEYFQNRRMIFIGYSIKDFTTWTSFISVLHKSKENKDGMRTHFLVSPVNSHHYSNFWKQYNISHIPLKAHEFLTAVHSLLGNLDDKNGNEHIAIAAAAACAGKTYQNFIPELEAYRRQHSYRTNRLAAVKWLRKGCHESK